MFGFPRKKPVAVAPQRSEELSHMLRQHEIWLQDDEENPGERADFAYKDLAGANLAGANLESANFGKVSLAGTILRDASLRGVNLKSVLNLQTEQLEGTDIFGATLPESLSDFKGLSLVDNISSPARGIFLTAIGACVFCWLTIATVKDVDLFLNSSSTELPIINSAVPIAGFFMVAPLILLVLYTYLHLYLERMFQALGKLPAVFQDGRTLEERAFPWLLTSLVSQYVPRLREKRRPFVWLPFVLSIFSAWWLVPLTIAWFWLRYLPLHEWFWTAWHMILLVASVSIGIVYLRIVGAALKNSDLDRPLMVISWGERAWFHCRRLFPMLVAAIFTFLTSYGAINSIPGGFKLERAQEANLVGSESSKIELFLRQFIPQVFEWAGSSAFLDLAGAELVPKPEAWDEKVALSDEELDKLPIRFFRARNLRFSSLQGAFLPNSDLWNATLEGANLSGANLQGAEFVRARLGGATLDRAKLMKAYANNAILSGASLVHANFTNAKLAGAHLERADLSGAIFQEAELRKADLRATVLEKANFEGANLSEANLSRTNLLRTNLSQANLSGAKLRTAELKQDQINDAYCDGKTELPTGIKDVKCKENLNRLVRLRQEFKLFGKSAGSFDEETLNSFCSSTSLKTPNISGFQCNYTLRPRAKALEDSRLREAKAKAKTTETPVPSQQ